MHLAKVVKTRGSARTVLIVKADRACAPESHSLMREGRGTCFSERIGIERPLSVSVNVAFGSIRADWIADLDCRKQSSY